MSETSGGKKQIGFGELGDLQGYALPKTDDADSSSFADYEDSPDKVTIKENAPNAHIVKNFTAQDKRTTVMQGKRMKDNGVAGMTKTTGPKMVGKARSADLDKSHQIGFER